MKRKKLLSTAVAGALVAAQMVMPAMAADGGGFDVIVTTKTPVLRVEVPTTMEIAVNQFEMGDAGSQIYSNAFKMENKSEIPVKVTVTSTATIPSTTTLVATKAAATGSTTKGEAWLAAVAQTNANKYIEEAGKTINDLTETSANVTTFTAADKKAEQTYYLDKSSAMAYKLLNAGEDADDIEYAQFYELTVKNFTATDNDAELNTALESEDIYYIVTASIDNGVAVNKIAKGSTGQTHSTSNTYYTVAQSATAKASIDAYKLYLYGDGTKAATGGEAAFRYIGKLSGKNETWTATDLSQISVAYTILGVQQNDYDALAAQSGTLTYGYYKAPVAAPSITTTSYQMTAGTAITIPVNLGSGNLAATGIDAVNYAGSDMVTNGYASYSNGVITVDSSAIDIIIGQSGNQTLTVVFDDAASTSVNVTLTH